MGKGGPLFTCLSRRPLLKSAGVSLAACSIGVPAIAAEDAGPLGASEASALGHGPIERILLVCEEALRRRPGRPSIPVDVVMRACELTGRYVERYHQSLEEGFVFPSIEKCGDLSSAVRTLREQHEQMRKLTDHVMGLCKEVSPGDLDSGLTLAQGLSRLVLLYRTHLALEDDVVLPAFLEELANHRNLSEPYMKAARRLAGASALKDMAARLGLLEQELSRFS